MRILLNNVILVIGAQDSPSNKVAIYDPSASKWTRTAALYGRYFEESVTRFFSGEILVVGSDRPYPGGLFDSEKQTWSAVGSTHHAFYGHTATFLPNGEVLIAGGWNEIASTKNTQWWTKCELYDPKTQLFREIADMFSGRRAHTGTLLQDGRVLVAGGLEAPHEWFQEIAIADCEIYDPKTASWSETGSLHHARGYHQATLLPNGKVLVTGGERDNQSPLSQSELYDPKTQIWTELK